MESIAKVSFVEDIQSMMYASGDCRRPLFESASIVEEVVYRQMVWFVHQAQTLADRSGEQFLDAEHILHALSFDRPLLSHVVQALKTMDAKRVNVEGGDELDADSNAFEEKGRRMRFCKRVLEKIDLVGDVSAEILRGNAIHSATKTERLRRILAYGNTMDVDEYLRFSDARQVTFVSKTGSVKFRQWLFGVDPFFDEYKPNSLTVEILCVLARETLATLMDCVLTVKKETSVAAAKPEISMIAPSTNGTGSGEEEEGGEECKITEEKFEAFGSQSANIRSQRVALLLSNKLRAKPQNRNVQYGLDKLIKSAVQPWELREAVRRLRFVHGNSPFTLFESTTIAKDRVIF